MIIANKSRWARTELTLICGLFTISLLIRLALVLPTQFDGLYGQDAYAYFDYAKGLQTSLQTDTALKPFFWPLGYPALLAAGLSISGTQPTVAQAISILMGAALTPLVYIIARQIGTKQLGRLTAAAVMTLCGQALQSSVVVMSDIPALFWATVSAMLLIRYLTPNSPLHMPETTSKSKWLILAVVTLTIAGITRWIYLVLGLPFALAILIKWHGRIKWRPTVISLVVTALILLPQFLYSRNNPFPTLDHAWVEGWSPDHAFQSSFTNIDGHFDYEKINALYYAQPFYDPDYLSPIFTLFILIGLWALAQCAWWQLIIFSGWVLLPYLFLAGIPYQNIRFPLIVFPAVALLVGTGIDVLTKWLQHAHFRRYKFTHARWFIVLLILVGLWHMWDSANKLVTTFITNQQKDKLAATWVSATLPADATVYTFGLTLTLQHYTTFDVHEIYNETPQTLADKLQKNNPDTYLVLNVWNIENQWTGRDPQLVYHWLRDQQKLIRIGKYGYYTVYKIRK